MAGHSTRPHVYYVYILRCADGSFYVGHTTEPRSREQTHNEGRGPRYTAHRLPVQLVYSEQHALLADAVRRERQIKRWTHAKKEALVTGNLELLKRL